ncbi:MAG: 3-oxo-tetronate kinase [Variibacter sp.]
MPLVLGCIADDYTGASDLANTLTKNGLRTVQTIGVPNDALALPDVDAVVVALKIRSIAADEAVAAARAANRWLSGHEASHILYKVCSTFDSTDKGNIGPITDALREDIGARDVTIVTPAFPETARTVYFGNLFVGTVPLNESPLKDHPLNPMHDSNLVRVLARQSRGEIGLVDFGTISGGTAAVRAKLAALGKDGHTAAIADAILDHDLEVIGEVAAEAKLSVGASGIGLGLARALVKSGRVKSAATDFTDAMKPVGGFVAAVAGSCSKATLEQIAVAERAMPVRRLDPARLMDGSSEVEDALTWASDKLAKGPVLIASSTPPDVVAQLQSRYGREASGHAIEQATARVAAELVARGAKRLVVAGGETSGAAVDRLGIPAFLVGPEIAPGVPVLRTVGRKDGDMLLALKSGNFGGPDFFTKAFGMMP